MNDNDIEKLFGIPGFSIGSEPFFVDKAVIRPYVLIEISRNESLYECTCGQKYDHYYDSLERQIRDLSFGKWDIYYVFHQVRVDCSECGVINGSLSWIEPYQRYTKRFSIIVAQLCQKLPVKNVAEHFDLDWKTVKRMDKKYLNEKLNPPDFNRLKILAVDEIAIRKGHTYATVIIDFERRRLVWAVKGRKEENLSEFYKLIGKKKCSKIQAVAMDMWKAFIKATRIHCPQAQIIFDKFHVVAKFSKVIDIVRNQEYRNSSEKDKAIIKDSKFLLLKNHNNLKSEQKIKLDDLLKINKKLSKLYILKDDLKQLWSYKYPKAARNFFDDWYRRAMYSKIKALKGFAKMLKRHWDGIEAFCHFPINTSVLEGMNNKSKVIKRMAYGYHDENYYFLKLRAAFPGKKII